MNKKSEVGQRGEELAAQYLAANGFEILHRNWRAGKGQSERGEIDIVAVKDKMLHFVEVKSRRNTSLEGDFAPTAAMNYRKSAIVTRTAEKYIEINDCKSDVQIDLITVNFNGSNRHFIAYFPNI